VTMMMTMPPMTMTMMTVRRPATMSVIGNILGSSKSHNDENQYDGVHFVYDFFEFLSN